jgi:hypothetical protein
VGGRGGAAGRRSREGLRLSSFIRRVPGMTLTLPPHSAAPSIAHPAAAAGSEAAGASGPPTAMFELDGSVMHWRIPPGNVMH